MPLDLAKIQKFPALPGVYLMKNEDGKVLYVGKANHLRNRVKQYFTPGRDGRMMVPYLTAQVEEIDVIVVTSEKEALILENNLIKQHRPKYNALLKDDKTYSSLAINHKHMWPMIRVVRNKGKPPPGNLYFGPYTHAMAARKTLELLRSLFPLRQCSDRELVSRTRPCILYDLKRCIAPCVAKCTKSEYDTYVTRVISFLRGHDSQILKGLKEEMKLAVENLEFEKADRLYQTILSIETTLEKQKVEKAGTHDLDALALARQLDRVVVTQLLFREGKLIASQDHLFPHVAQSDEEVLTSFILQEYTDKDALPPEILLPFKIQDQEILEELLQLKVATPERGNKKELVKMAETNAQERLKREETADPSEQLLMQMEETLHLLNYPERIECFDNSNTSGTEPVSAMIVYTQGKKDSKLYRKYKLKTADDYNSMKEVLTRRYTKAKEEDNLPDLILLDGGKGHLNLALAILSELDISTVDVVAIAKEEGKHTKGMTAEQIFLVGEKEPLMLKPDSPLLLFLQQIRDEAHRFAITFQRERRKKKTLSSVFDTLAGIGPIKKKRLLHHFGSWKRIMEATEEEWSAVKGITKRDIATLKENRDRNHT